MSVRSIWLRACEYIPVDFEKGRIYVGPIVIWKRAELSRSLSWVEEEGWRRGVKEILELVDASELVKANRR